MSDTTTVQWWAKGLLFENCNCQVVCPGHVHFEQECTHDRCMGYWAVRVDAGAFGEVGLAGIKAVVTYDSPPRMIDGGWTQTIVIDDAASDSQRAAMETILRGDAGGPWEVLSRFVGTRLPTQHHPIHLEDEPMRKRVSIAGIMEATVENLRGRDKTKPVLFENIFNQIHAPQQAIMRGDTDYDDGEVVIHNRGSHGLASDFHWTS